MLCKSCGKKVDINKKFCTNCGWKIEVPIEKQEVKKVLQKEPIQEVVQENKFSDESVQEEENNEIPEFSSRFFLDSDTIRLITTMSKRIELSPVIAWIITLFHQLKNILPKNSTIEPTNDDINENIFVRQ